MLTRPLSVEFVLSGTHLCGYNDPEGDALLLTEMTWILGTVWAILALCLAVWIPVKHFRQLQRRPTGWAIWGCFTILIKTHVFFFAR
jgi:glucan phosphoethanolaminetransferase (alkaline phosphatase superfamily)